MHTEEKSLPEIPQPVHFTGDVVAFIDEDGIKIGSVMDWDSKQTNDLKKFAKKEEFFYRIKVIMTDENGEISNKVYVIKQDRTFKDRHEVFKYVEFVMTQGDEQ